MAVSTARVTAGTTAVQIGVPDADGKYGSSIILRNRGTNSVFLGSSNVTSNNGFQLDAGESLTAEFFSTDAWFVITASGTSVCHVLQTGI